MDDDGDGQGEDAVEEGDNGVHPREPKQQPRARGLVRRDRGDQRGDPDEEESHPYHGHDDEEDEDLAQDVDAPPSRHPLDEVPAPCGLQHQEGTHEGHSQPLKDASLLQTVEEEKPAYQGCEEDQHPMKHMWMLPSPSFLKVSVWVSREVNWRQCRAHASSEMLSYRAW